MNPRELLVALLAVRAELLHRSFASVGELEFLVGHFVGMDALEKTGSDFFTAAARSCSFSSAGVVDGDLVRSLIAKAKTTVDARIIFEKDMENLLWGS